MLIRTLPDAVNMFRLSIGGVYILPSLSVFTYFFVVILSIAAVSWIRITLMRIWIRGSDADPDPTFHPVAYPDLDQDPSSQVKTKK